MQNHCMVPSTNFCSPSVWSLNHEQRIGRTEKYVDMIPSSQWSNSLMQMTQEKQKEYLIEPSSQEEIECRQNLILCVLVSNSLLDIWTDSPEDEGTTGAGVTPRVFEQHFAQEWQYRQHTSVIFHQGPNMYQLCGCNIHNEYKLISLHPTSPTAIPTPLAPLLWPLHFLLSSSS